MAGKVSDDEFLAAWRTFGSPEQVAKVLGLQVRGVYERRKRMEAKLGMVLPATKDLTGRAQVSLPKRGHRHIIEGYTGPMVVFSDAHFWPNEPKSIAYLALLEIIRELKPKAVICNGDAFDGARVSRHAPADWMNLPDVADEIEVCQERLGEIERTAPKDAKLYSHFGNHCTRFAARLAMQAPEYVRVHGTDLKDHLPAWSWSWSSMVNGHTMIKHRYHQGIHAGHQNALKSGVNIVTGHLHKLQVTPWGDYNGRRWAVDTGTLSDWGPEVDKFAYAEDNPVPWGQGFAVLTFDNRGRLLPPELVEVLDGIAYFRGQTVVSKTVKRKAS